MTNNMTNNILLIFFILIIIIIYKEKGNCHENFTNSKNSKNSNINQGSNECLDESSLDSKLELEYADTNSKMSIGLSKRTKPLQKLIIHQGMIFDFKDMNSIRTMTMKDTSIPLDMIFINEENKIVGFIEDAQPFNVKPYSIDKKSRYVIELNAGTIKKTKLKIGDILDENKLLITEKIL